MISGVANLKLTHVTYNVENPNAPHPFKTISYQDVISGTLAGHHLLIDVPLKHLKLCVSK